MPRIKTQSITGLAQADGAQIFALDTFDGRAYHQFQIAVSATPAAGTLSFSIETPGATGFVALDGSVDMTDSTTYLITFGPVFASRIKITPASFDADKTYSIYLCTGGNA